MHDPDANNPWGQADPDGNPGPGPRAGAARRRAAIMLWVLGVLQFLAATCCCTAPIFVLTQPLETLEEAAENANVPVQMLLDMRQHAGLWIGMIVGLVMLPAVAYLILGFGVRAGKRWAAGVALLIALTQTIVVGVLLLANIANAIVQGSPANVTMQVLTLGSAMAILIYCMRLLLAVRRDETDDAATDPWDETGR